MSEANVETHNDSIWETVRRNPRALMIIGAVAIYLITFAAYWTALRGDFIWDDDHYVSNNAMLRSMDGLPQIWNPSAWLQGRGSPMRVQYYPLTLTTFWIEYQLWGNNPVGYHVVNVFLHATTAFLLWIVLRRLNVPGAWAAAAVFALHPINVESVAWITERKNVLSGVFYFATLLVYMKYMEIRSPDREPKPESQAESLFSLPEDETRVYALAIFLFACALLSKTVTATLPAAILLIIWWKRGRITLKEFLPLIPFFILGIGMGVLTGIIERTVIGASGPGWQFGATWLGEIGARLIIAGRAIWFYAGKILFPMTLLFNYPRWNISAEAIWQYLFPLTVLTSVLSLWGLRKRIGRAPLAGVLFFVGTLVPALGFVNVFPMQYSFVADHFAYLASIGLIVVIIAALARGIERMVALNMLNLAAAPAAIVILLGALMIRTASQGFMYENLKTLWETTIRGTGNRSVLAANNYGLWILRNRTNDPKDLEQAERYFWKALALTGQKHAMAWFNLGMVEERRSNYELAMKRFRNTLAIEPDYPPAQFKVAEMLTRLGRTEDAIKAYRIIVKQNPESEQAHQNLGVLLARTGQLEEAIEQFTEAAQINPNSVPANLALADSLANAKNIPEALRAYGRVVQIDPKNAGARIGTGRLMMVMDKLNEAEAQFKLAIEYDSKLAEPQYLLGLVYMQKGKYDEAIAPLTKATELAPRNERMKLKLEEAKDLLAHPEKRPATTRSTTVPTTSSTRRS
ncbi:MAG: tetratricopeptide repeat protein [Anaerolineae bacterium]|nr:tetratricopeptide repeat protein [Phycisphaerae bacterium]